MNAWKRATRCAVIATVAGLAVVPVLPGVVAASDPDRPLVCELHSTVFETSTSQFLLRQPIDEPVAGVCAGGVRATDSGWVFALSGYGATSGLWSPWWTGSWNGTLRVVAGGLLPGHGDYTFRVGISWPDGTVTLRRPANGAVVGYGSVRAKSIDGSGRGRLEGAFTALLD